MVTTTDETGWLLVIEGPLPPVDDFAASSSATTGEPFELGRRILGLTVPLRLALTAQALGARAIAIADSPAQAEVKNLLADDRLRLRVIDEGDRPSLLEFRSSSPSIRVAANLVVPRATFAALLEDATGELILPPGASGTLLVSDKASAGVARRALLRSLRKPQDGWTSRYLNRYVSLFITRFLVATPLQPNQVSVAILGVGMLGAWLASRGTYVSMLTGAALFQAQSILDGCDGEMSRLTFRGSRLGEWLDTIGDDLTNYGFFAGAAWGLYATTGHAVYLALGALTVSCGIVGSGLEYRYLVRIGSGDLLKYPLGIGKAPGAGAADSSKSALGRALDAISPLFKRDTFVLLTLVGAALGWLGPFLAVFAAGAIGVLWAVIKAELRMARERVDPILPRD
jgi:phosphatidylglycerophosphate synthase